MSCSAAFLETSPRASHLTKLSRSALLALLVVACGSGSEAESREGEDEIVAPPKTRDVVLVGNSVAGTVTVLDGHTFDAVGSIDVVPDIRERLQEIHSNPLRAVPYALVKHNQSLDHFEPHDGDRFVDDLFLSPNGETLYVSRSNLGDVVAFDVTKPDHPIVWRTRVEGVKADHATLSPDGSRLVVSATSVEKAQVLDARTGAIIGSFPTGSFPHQNDYSADGKHLYNGSTGNVSLPPGLDFAKGKRRLTVVDAETLKVVRTYDFDAGIRPAVITADESVMYAQLSFLNGLVKFDLKAGKIVHRLEEPLSPFARETYASAKEPNLLHSDLPHDSMHHGLALSGDGEKLCDVGTIDDTVSIVSTSAMQVISTVDVGKMPYWATTSLDGKSCLVSLSGGNAVQVIDYETGRKVKEVPVGMFPQRNRNGRLTVQAKLDAGNGARDIDHVLAK